METISQEVQIAVAGAAVILVKTLAGYAIAYLRRNLINNKRGNAKAHAKQAALDVATYRYQRYVEPQKKACDGRLPAELQGENFREGVKELRDHINLKDTAWAYEKKPDELDGVLGHLLESAIYELKRPGDA